MNYALNIKEVFMKNLVKRLAVIAFVAIAGFSMLGCIINVPDDNNGGTTTSALNGTWKGLDNAIVKISGNSGIFIQVSTTTVWQRAKSNGNIDDGDLWMMNLEDAGYLKWTCQERLVRSNYSVYWGDCTITLAEDGKSFQTYISSSSYNTWTKQ
jgi:hypothetical protein